MTYLTEDDMYISNLSYEERKELEQIQLMKHYKIEGEKEGEAKGLAKGIAKGKKEGLAEGKKEGLAESKIEIAKNLIMLNISFEDISKATGLSIDELNKLKEEK